MFTSVNNRCIFGLSITTKRKTMTTVNQIQQSSIENKSALYLQLAQELAEKSQSLIGSSSFLNRMHSDLMSHFRNCESADCEFSAYREAIAVEVWFTKIEGLKTGKLKFSDVI